MVLLSLPLIISAGVNIDFSSERGGGAIEARITRSFATPRDHGWDALD